MKFFYASLKTSIGKDLLMEEVASVYGHDTEKVIGVVQNAYSEGGRLYADIRFSSSNFAQSIKKDIIDGIRKNVSVGYSVEEFLMINSADERAVKNSDNIPTMLVTKWKPIEISSVGAPADCYVGYQRSDEEFEIPEIKTEETVDTKVVEAVETKACDEKEDKEQTKECQETEDNKECSEDNKKECDEDTEDKTSSKTETTAKSAENINNIIEGKKKMEKFSLRKAMLAKMGKIPADSASYELDKIQRNIEDAHIKDDCIYLKNEDIMSIRSIDGSEVLNQPNYRPDLYTPELRPQSVIARTGARKVTVDDGADIKFGVCTSGLTAGFVGLNNEIPSGTMDWELKELKPKKMGCYVQIDYKALLQDRPDVENIILDDIVKALDQVKDEAMIKGTGADNQPLGIYSTSGVNEVTIPSSGWDLETCQTFEEKIRESNDYSDNLTWVMNTHTFFLLQRTPYSSTAVNEFLIDKEHKCLGYPVVICNALPNDGVILGNFNELLVGEYDGMRIDVMVDASLNRKQAREVQAFASFDCIVRRLKSFSVSKPE